MPPPDVTPLIAAPPTVPPPTELPPIVPPPDVTPLIAAPPTVPPPIVVPFDVASAGEPIDEASICAYSKLQLRLNILLLGNSLYQACTFQNSPTSSSN